MNRHLYEIASSTGSDFSKAYEAQVLGAQRAFNELEDNMAKNAPAGSETAVAAFKTAVSAGNNALESVQKAVKQATDLTQAQVRSMSEQVSGAAKSAAKKR